MAVGAQDTKVLDAVVHMVAVDVIEGERKRLTEPCVEAAGLARDPEYINLV